MLFIDDTELIPNLRAVSDNLLRGGQPSREGFLDLQKNGTRTIINLREEPWLIDEERRLIAELGLDYVSIPLSPFREPTDAEIEEFLKVALEPARQPVFVHCLHGQDRTGAMVCIYRMEVHGWSFDQAYAEMVAHGYHPEFFALRCAALRFASRKGLIGGENPPGLKVG